MKNELIGSVIYRCTTCVHEGEDCNDIPCVIIMADGDIPDHCVFGHCNAAKWELMR